MVQVTQEAAQWLRAISTWLLETDNDMKLPEGILDIDPLNLACELECLTQAQAETAALRAALIAAGIAAGAGLSDEVSNEFLSYVPEQVRGKIAALRERCERLEEALTPSGDTKAAYMGEFSFGLTRMDEAGDEYSEKVYVPWTTIKEIMAAIAARTALANHDG